MHGQLECCGGLLKIIAWGADWDEMLAAIATAKWLLTSGPVGNLRADRVARIGAEGGVVTFDVDCAAPRC